MNSKSKLSLLLTVLLFSACVLNAQEYHVTKSDAFDEPGPGWNHLLQLKNGNTFLFHIGSKGSVDISVFDKNRKVVATKSVTSKLWDVADASDKWLYEINGEPVLFLNLEDHQQRTLVRIRFNPSDGGVINEETLATVGEPKTFATVFGSLDVSKDPQSDHYAVVTCGRSRMGVEKMTVMHYDGSHKKINETEYKGGPTGFMFINYKSMLVDGGKRIFLILCGYTEKPKFNQSMQLTSECKVIISKVNAGEKTFSNKTMELNVDLSDVTSQMVYNRNSNQVQLRTKSLSESKKKVMSTTITRYYLSLMTYFDPETLEIVNIKPLIGQKVSEYGQKHIDKEYEFNGLPNKMVINKDKTTSVLMEKTSSIESKSYRGDIGVSVLSDTGAEVNGYAIEKLQQESHGVNNEQFMSYDYISTPKGNFVLFNDYVTNFNKDEDEAKHKKISTVSLTNTVGYKLNGSGIDKFLFFGAPDDKSNVFSYMDGTDYCDGTNTYATVIIERKGRIKEAHVAWVTFD